MIITAIEKLDAKKAKIYIDEEYAFLLYVTDIRKYRLTEGIELEQDIYEDIWRNTVLRRGKQKALAILKRMDRTESEIRNKLKQGYYTEEIINEVIKYIKSYHYIDDERYANSFVRCNKCNKSKLMIKMQLINKGVDKDKIENALIEEEVNEEEIIEKLIKKKTQDINSLTFEEKQKLAASLYRKGFSSDIINKKLY